MNGLNVKFIVCVFACSIHLYVTMALLDALPDINECELSDRLCRNGQCINMVGRYQCFCDTGYKSTESRLECVGGSLLLCLCCVCG